MRVGISTASFFNTCNLEDAPARIASLGASECEIFLNTFSEYEPKFIRLLLARVQDAGLSVYSVHPMGSQYEAQLFSLHPRQRADANSIFERVLEAMQMLGARYYIMHGPGGQFGVVKNMELSRIGHSLRGLCEKTRQYGISIAWENVSWCLFSNPQFGVDLFNATGLDDLYFTLDIKQAVRSGYSPLQYIDAIGEHLVNLHVCDYAHTTDGHVIPILPGRGECDLVAVRAALENKGYSGSAFLEVYSDLYRDDAELLESFRYVCNCLT